MGFKRRKRPLKAAAANIAGLSGQVSQMVYNQREEGAFYAFVNVLGNRLIGIEVPMAPYEGDELDMVEIRELKVQFISWIKCQVQTLKGKVPIKGQVLEVVDGLIAFVKKVVVFIKDIKAMKDKDAMTIVMKVVALLLPYVLSIFPSA